MPQAVPRRMFTSMSDFNDLAIVAHAEMLASFGEAIGYRATGKGEPIDAVGILLRPAVQQSSAPGYFADVQVDPAVIVDPQKGDVVVWADGVEYVVSRVIAPPYELTTLVLFRQDDPIEVGA